MYTRGSDEKHLDALFEAYRAACPEPEPSAGFMPQLWQRIEGRRTFSFFVGRIASGFVTAAVAATLAMAIYIYLPRANNVYYSESYVEALAAGHPTDSVELFDATYLDPPDSAGEL